MTRAVAPPASLRHLVLVALATLPPLPLFAQLAPAPPPVSRQSPAPGQPGLAPPANAVTSPHLDAAPSVIRDSGAEARGTVTLVVDVIPKRGMRVYAPGNKTYSAVTMAVDVPPGATVGAVRRPPAESYLFVPLRERVMVYREPFRLTREMRVGSAGVPTRVEGRLEYQACDDKVCYRPQTLPIAWRIDK